MEVPLTIYWEIICSFHQVNESEVYMCRHADIINLGQHQPFVNCGQYKAMCDNCDTWMTRLRYTLILYLGLEQYLSVSA